MPNYVREDYLVRQAQADSGAPGSGTYNVMDLVENNSPALNNPLFWVCTSGGSPGTWIAGPPLANVSNVVANSAAASIPVTANIVSITGSGGYNLTLAAPAAANNGSAIRFVNASSGTVTLVAATGAAVVGTATIPTLTGASVHSVSTNWYRV